MCKPDQHRYFVADVAQVETEGRIVVIALCTACGDTFSEDFQITKKDK